MEAVQRRGSQAAELHRPEDQAGAGPRAQVLRGSRAGTLMLVTALAVFVMGVSTGFSTAGTTRWLHVSMDARRSAEPSAVREGSAVIQPAGIGLMPAHLDREGAQKSKSSMAGEDGPADMVPSLHGELGARGPGRLQDGPSPVVSVATVSHTAEAQPVLMWSSTVHDNLAMRGTEDTQEENEATQGAKKEKKKALAKSLEFEDANQPPAQEDDDSVNTTPMDARLRQLPDSSWHALLKPESEKHKASHASTLLLVPSGELVCAWFWGEEGQSAVAIVMANLRLGADRWTDLRLVSSQGGRSAQNPVLFMLNSTMVLLHTSQAAGKGQGTAEIRVHRSRDQGYSWTPGKQLFKESGAMIRNPPIPSLASPGEWLLPVYYTPSGMGHTKDQYAVMKWSSQPASSWPQAKTARISAPGQGLVQPAAARLPNNDILVLLRDRNEKNIYSSLSKDEGRTWSRTKNTHLPNNNKAVMACVLPSGALALMFTNSNLWSKKYPMSLALSFDGGKTWPHVRDLQENFQKGGCRSGCEYSYPSVVWAPRQCRSQDHDPSGPGSLHMSYTYSRPPQRRVAIRYVCIDDPEAWVQAGPPSQGVYSGNT